MPKCPHCGSVSKQRKKGCCRICGEPVESVRFKNETVWVAEGTDASGLVDLLEHKIQTHFGLPTFSFGDSLSERRWAQIAAAKTLLDRCGWDQCLANAVIEAYYAQDRRLVPPKSMMGVIGKQWSLALAITKKRIEEAAKLLLADEWAAQRGDDDISVLELYSVV